MPEGAKNCWNCRWLMPERGQSMDMDFYCGLFGGLPRTKYCTRWEMYGEHRGRLDLTPDTFRKGVFNA